MAEITEILDRIKQGDADSAEALVSLVYHELRRLAAAKLAREQPGQTLQATALANEAYLRLMTVPDQQCFDNRRHFYGAASRAMRRILVENARKKASQKRGGQWQRVEFEDTLAVADSHDVDILALNEALTRLEQEFPEGAQVVEMRFFMGNTVEEIAEEMEISTDTVNRRWKLARAMLYGDLGDGVAIPQ